MALGLGAVAILLLALGPAAASRLALVLGSTKYQNVPTLENPANDAQDLAASLRQLGFDVIEQHDASREAMARAVHDFSDRLPGAMVALFLYAGHGLQMNGENDLVPVDAKIQNAADIRFNTINLMNIQGEMEGSGRTSSIILDACRDNPFADKLAQSGHGLGTRGLVRMEAAAQGSLIVYSTQPNNVALDGAGRNSPFTAALLKHVTTPGLEVRQMISRVRGDMLTATANKQTPWDTSSLVGDVYLASAPDGAAPQAVVVPPRASAVSSLDGSDGGAQSPRDRHIQRVEPRGSPDMAERGRMEWQKATGHGRRNQAKTAIFRHEHLIGPKLRARSLPAQRGDAAIAKAVLNQVIPTAKPVSIRVA